MGFEPKANKTCFLSSNAPLLNLPVADVSPVRVVPAISMI